MFLSLARGARRKPWAWIVATLCFLVIFWAYHSNYKNRGPIIDLSQNCEFFYTELVFWSVYLLDMSNSLIVVLYFNEKLSFRFPDNDTLVKGTTTCK